jgi:hypothetical protein
MTEPTERRVRNHPYQVPDEIKNIAIDVAYARFCRELGRWDPQMPGQRDAFKAALADAWEVSTNLIESAVLLSLRDELGKWLMAASRSVARHAEGSTERLAAASQLVTLTAVTELLASMIEDRDPFRLVET